MEGDRGSYDDGVGSGGEGITVQPRSRVSRE